VNTKFNGVDNVHTLTLETYDDLGRITTKKDKVLASAQTTTGYGYDSLGRLTSAGTTSWGYDPNGNRTHINGVTVASYDSQDRILTHQGASFTHDPNGNRKTKVQAGTTTYNYDRFGNLQSVLLPGGAVVSYDIDGAGRRVGRHKTGGTWRRSVGRGQSSGCGIQRSRYDCLAVRRCNPRSRAGLHDSGKQRLSIRHGPPW
jgi:YD repeat-containing protein